eukprot:14355602-Ditylum_brightwellii.AAC.1
MSIEISKPDEGDLKDIEIIRLSTLVPDMVMKRNLRKKKKKGRSHHGMILKEWRKRVKLTQEEVIKRKLLNCLHLYSNIEIKYRQETCFLSLGYME